MFLDINQHQCRQFKSTLTSVDFQCPSTVKQFSNIFRRSEQPTRIAGRTYNQFFQ